ncbi:hypothetical protein [Pendulispora albinea]|uniref:DUF7832 domain-containing protein n=1 Tax=Pendulispora albinea TaxID=2741071 RepID=A0ABZ2M732_9BACT
MTARRPRIYDDQDYYDSVNGGEHIGLFFAWALLRNLAASEWNEAARQLADRVKERARELRSGRLLDDHKLATIHLNDLGNAFARAYYDLYLEDYGDTLDDEAIREGSWEHFDMVVQMLDGRHAAWIAEGRKKTRPPTGGRMMRPAPPVVAGDEALVALEALDRLDLRRRSLPGPADRVLIALRKRAPDASLRELLLERAERGKVPSATTAVRALVERFDRETVLEALVRLESGKKSFASLEQLPDFVRELGQARQWKAETDLLEGVQRCRSRGLVPRCHLQLASLLLRSDLQKQVERAFIEAAVAHPDLPPRLAHFVANKFKLEPAQRAKVALPACIYRAETLDLKREFAFNFPHVLEALDELEKTGLPLEHGEGRKLVDLLHERLRQWIEQLPQLDDPYEESQELLGRLEKLFIDVPSNVAALPEMQRLWREVLFFDDPRPSPEFAFEVQGEIARLDKLVAKGMSLEEDDGRRLLDQLHGHWQRWLRALPSFPEVLDHWLPSSQGRARLVARKLQRLYAEDTPGGRVRPAEDARNEMLARVMGKEPNEGRGEREVPGRAGSPAGARAAHRSVLQRPEMQQLWAELITYLWAEPMQAGRAMRLLRAMWSAELLTEELMAEARAFLSAATSSREEHYFFHELISEGHEPHAHQLADLVRIKGSQWS